MEVMITSRKLTVVYIQIGDDVTMLMRQMLIFSITECVKINIDV